MLSSSGLPSWSKSFCTLATETGPGSTIAPTWEQTLRRCWITYTPSFLLASSAARYLEQFRTNRQVNAFLKGLAPAVLGMLLAAAISLGRAGIVGPVGLVIAGLSCASLFWLRPNPAWVVFVAGGARLVLSATGV